MKSVFIAALLLVLATAAFAFDSEFLAQPVHDNTLINKINTTPRVAWKAGSYKQFENMTLGQFRKVCLYCF